MGMVLAASRIMARSASVWPVVPMTRLVPCFKAASTTWVVKEWTVKSMAQAALAKRGVEILAGIVGGGDGDGGVGGGGLKHGLAHAAGFSSDE